VKQLESCFVEGSARWRKRYLSRRALQQLETKLLFQLLNPPSQGGLIYVEALGPAPKTELLGNDDE
jgi:hypothetical protein